MFGNRKVRLQVSDPKGGHPQDVWLSVGESLNAALPVTLTNSHGSGATLELNLIVKVLDIK